MNCTIDKYKADHIFLIFGIAVMQTFSFGVPATMREAHAIDAEPNQQSNVEPIVAEEKKLPGFSEGSALTLKPRSYYLNRKRDINQDSVGWALGGALEYRSGWWKRLVGVAATVYTSQKLYGPGDKDGTLLFKPGPKGFTVLGEANVTLRFTDKQGLRIGRQRFELPYLGSHDSRMVPNTFEAIAVGNTSPTGFAYMAGYVDSIKRRNDDKFIAMSAAAGAARSDQGVGFAGARYVVHDGTVIGAIYQHTSNIFDTLFAKVERAFPVGDESALKGYLQYTDQRSVGDALIGHFSTSLVAGKVELKHGRTTWRVGASSTGHDSGIRKPYGNPANYLSVIVDDFDRAGEKAWLVGLSHDFQRIGVGDLGTFANVVHGDTPDTGPNASPDEMEYDATLDYRIREGWAQNLWLRFRAALINQDKSVAGGEDILDFRVIANYAFDLI